MSDFKIQIENYQPKTEREALEKEIICRYIHQNPEDVLTRRNVIAHMTSSSMIFNPTFTKILMVYHNIYHSWSWTGGHTDGDTDLMATAVREAGEETGIVGLLPLTDEIMSLDILPVHAHEKNGHPVSAHLHLNACYVFTADELLPLKVKADENSRVGWIPANEVARYVSEAHMLPIYEKIIRRVYEMKEKK